MLEFVKYKSKELEEFIFTIEDLFTYFNNWDTTINKSNFFNYFSASHRKNYYLLQIDLIGFKKILDNAINKVDFKALKNEDILLFTEGRKFLRLLIDNVSLFEYLTFLIIQSDSNFKNKLDDKIEKEYKLNNLSVNENSSVKKLIKLARNKTNESSIIRRVLKDEKIITKEETEFLNVIWDIRNSIHKSYVPIKDIDFKFKIPVINKEIHLLFSKSENAKLKSLDMLHINVYLTFITLKIVNKFSNIEIE